MCQAACAVSYPMGGPPNCTGHKATAPTCFPPRSTQEAAKLVAGGIMQWMRQSKDWVEQVQGGVRVIHICAAAMHRVPRGTPVCLVQVENGEVTFRLMQGEELATQGKADELHESFRCVVARTGRPHTGCERGASARQLCAWGSRKPLQCAALPSTLMWSHPCRCLPPLAAQEGLSDCRGAPQRLRMAQRRHSSGGAPPVPGGRGPQRGLRLSRGLPHHDERGRGGAAPVRGLGSRGGICRWDGRPGPRCPRRRHRQGLGGARLAPLLVDWRNAPDSMPTPPASPLRRPPVGSLARASASPTARATSGTVNRPAATTVRRRTIMSW
jgi:hypothetical protein